MTAKRTKTDRSGELVKQLRDSARQVVENKTSLRALASKADIDAASLSRFLGEKGGLTLETADRLAAALGLRLSKR